MSLDVKQTDTIAEVMASLRKAARAGSAAAKAMSYVGTISKNGVMRYDKTHGFEVIFNPPATILINNGKKYISKATANEPFDEEKGLAITLLKAMGISYNDLKRLLHQAKRPYLVRDEMHEANEPLIIKSIRLGMTQI